jgi:hypothetical protein
MSSKANLEDSIELTSRQLINAMRKVVAPPGKRGTWLRRLSDNQLAEVYHRLKRGQPAYRIAKIAQEDWGVNRKADIKSMSRAIRAFKYSMLGDIELEKTSNSEDRKEEGRKLERRGHAIVEKLDGLGRLRWLIEVQTERVISIIDREKKALPFKFTDRSIEVLKDMINNYLEIQIKLGIIDAKPPELHLTMKHRFDGLIQHTVQPGSALVDWTDKFLESAEKEALTLRLGSDGQYDLLLPAVEGEDAACAEDSTAGEGA